jgi:drug/metabolite transporter (DMT)-like permease
VQLQLVLPLLAGVGYAAAALLLKRTADLGVGVWRTAFVANLVGGVVYAPLWALGGTLHPALWWQPVLLGALFTLGQWFSFTAIDRGDVSVATPVLGLKILLVALLVTIFAGEVLRWQLWAAAVLATLGIALLNRSGRQGAHHNVGRTIITASLAAAVFAVFDVLVQRWAPAWGTGRFVPLVMGVTALLSFGFVPLFRAPLSAIPASSWPWLLAGSVTLGVQSLGFVATVAQWGAAASANVLYSSRGLWSVVLVWIFGHWVRSREQHLGRSVLTWRLAGAVLMMSAIVLAVV